MWEDQKKAIQKESNVEQEESNKKDVNIYTSFFALLRIIIVLKRVIQF